MKIKESLPFDVCQNCDKFILKTNVETIFVNGRAEKVINVYCKREKQCKCQKKGDEKIG